MKLRLPLSLVLLLVAFIVPAYGAVTVDDIIDTPVVVEKGATISDADRALLDESARQLAAGGRDFPTRYVVVTKAPAGETLDEMAQRLRFGIADRKGIDNIDAVVVLTPGAMGISADAFNAEVADARVQEATTLKDHLAQGAVSVVNRLQKADAVGALEVGETESPDKGIATWVWIVGGVVVALGLVGLVLARRAAKRGERAKAAADEQGAGSPDDEADAEADVPPSTDD